MARIPNEEIERLKKEITIERLVTGFGVELKRQGKDLFGRCPFHDDKTPSLSVTPETNLWHCLGACNSGGDVIAWVMKTRGVSFRHAVELLKNDHPCLAAGGGHVVRKGTTVKLTSPVAADADDQRTLRGVVGFYRETLQESPEALKYLEGRGLVHPEMVEHFQIGFANRKLGLTLPDKNRKEGAELRGHLQRLGLLRESGHEHFNGSVVFPIFDLEGSVLGLYGRKITPNLREGTLLHLYLPGPHRGVWNEEALEASKEIVLCESIIDALTFWCAGFRNVTASYGVNGFTDDHKAAFARHEIKNVWIAYDRDEAGDQAAERLKEELVKLGIGSHRVLFPRGMDANEYARKVTPASQSLAVLLNRAEWLAKAKPAAKEEVVVQEVMGPEPLPAVATSLAAEPPAPDRGDEITMSEGDRRYRIRGLAKNLSHELLKVNVLVSCGNLFHVDTLDLYSARQRAAFTKQASEELQVKEETLRRDLGRVLLQLEKRQEAHIHKALTPTKAAVRMTAEEQQEALRLLKDPKLLDRILEHFDACGVVGEEPNKLVGYLAAVSRHLEAPLAIVVQSSSAAGKSSLMDAVLAFVPEEERIQYSAMTGQSLYYMGERDLKHKVLAIVEEGGASRAAYALKLLQSEGVLTIASTGKDPATGKLVTHQYRVEGPVMMFLTTTAIDLDDELLNRCLVLSVNEDRAQTQAIHRLQRERQTLEGLLRKQKRQALIKLHQNAQRLLQPLFVVNPYALELTFPDERTRMRRDHGKYLTLIASLTLLHQHQRTVRTASSENGSIAYVEATREDIATADRLMKELLARSLDELPPQTRRLLTLIAQMVETECREKAMRHEDVRFSRKQVRDYSGWGATQVRVHLDRLQEMEYLTVHRGGRGQTFLYEYDGNLAAPESPLAGSKRPQNGRVAAPGRINGTLINTGANGLYGQRHENSTDTGLT
jgi:DNA primase